MSARHVPGPGAAVWEGSSGSSSSSSEVGVAGNLPDAERPTTTDPTPCLHVDEFRLRRHQHHHQQHQNQYENPHQYQSDYQHQHHQDRQHQFQPQVRDELPIPRPHSPRSTDDTPLHETSDTLSPGRTVDRLVRKLSKQRLQSSRPSHRQPPPPPPQQQQQQPTPATRETPELRRFREWARRELFDPPPQQPQVPEPPAVDYALPWLSLPTHNVGEPIEIDEAYADPTGAAPEPPEDRRLLDVRRPRRQPSGQLRPGDRRVEDMIANGDQCNVRSEPSMAPPPLTRPVAATPAFIEPDPDCAMPELEFDDHHADGGIPGLPRDAEGSTIALRYTSGPGGIRKYTVGGVALRYRLSADAALRCANVVRSRPRMRKRTKTRHGSAASSAMTSAVTSPAMSSAPSPPLPATHLPL